MTDTPKTAATERDDFRDIPSCPNYKINSIGQILSNLTGLLRSPHLRNGYLNVGLKCPDKYRTKRIAPLVLETFVCPRPDNLECAHLNGIRTDNRVENLQWVTRIENAGHRELHGTQLKGEQVSVSKLKESEVIEIIDLLKTDIMQKDIAALFGVDRWTIGCIKYGKSWNHLTGLPKHKKEKGL